MASTSAACFIASVAKPASPNARAPRCSTPACPTTRPSPCCTTSPRAAGCARPAAYARSARTPSPAMACGPATTPRSCTTSWWPFPPNTREVQFDEKWSFVAKKEKHCNPQDPADDERGDCWDHVALDPEHRLVVSVVTGRRTAEHTHLLVEDFHRRTGGRLMNLMTSDENPAYAEAILEGYGEEVRPRRTGRPGRPRQPYKRVPEGLKYATVHKTRKQGRVVKVEPRVVFGTVRAVLVALAVSLVSVAVNTVFVERNNGSDRQ